MSEYASTETGFSQETVATFTEAYERGDAEGALDALDADLDRRRDAAAAARSALATPEETVPTPEEGILAAARQAAEKRERRAKDAKLLRDHLAEQHAGEADAILRLSNDEVFQLAGIEKSAQQLRDEEQEQRANDPTERKAAAQRDLMARWWTLAPSDREAQARALGGDPAAIEAELWRQENSRTRY